MAKSPKLSRKHLPALSRLELEAVQARLALTPSVSPAGKKAVMDSLKAAANPNAESPEVVIKTLDHGEQLEVIKAQHEYAATLNAPIARGRARLMAMSDDEWSALLDESERKS